MGGWRKGKKKKGKGSTLEHKLLEHYLRDYKQLTTSFIHETASSRSVPSREQASLTQNTHVIKPTTIDGIQLPNLQDTKVLEQPFLAFPKELSSYHRSIIHDICTDEVHLFHCGVDGTNEGERFVAVSIYSDGFDHVPGITESSSKHVEHYRPWIMKQNVDVNEDMEMGKKMIWELIDQPGRCLRDACDTIDLRENDDLSTIEPPASGDTKCLLIDTAQKMKDSIQYLTDNKPTEIAFDLECYNRSKELQMTCLIQLATNTGKTYIIDVLAEGVWDQVHGLAGIFSDKSIVKIGHGIRGLDIQSLQRDFGIFVVNAFDTFEAAQVLKLEGKGLATICSYYGLQTSELYHDLKQNYQATNWTKRPLTDPMILYGRYDVHYLIQLRKLMTRDLVRSATLPMDYTSSLQDLISSMNQDDGVEEESHIDENLQYQKVTGQQEVFPAKDLRMSPGLMRVLSKSQENCLKFWNSNPGSPLRNKRFVSLATKKAFTDAQLKLYHELAAWRVEVSKEMETLPGKICSLDFLSRVAFHRPLTENGLLRIQYDLPPCMQNNKKYKTVIISLVKDSLDEDDLVAEEESFPTFEEFKKRQLAIIDGGVGTERLLSNPMFWAASFATLSIVFYGFLRGRRRS